MPVTALDERSVYSAIADRPQFTWPGGARLAVWIAVNVEHYEFMPPDAGAWPRVPAPDVSSYAAREYGNRVGLWRLLSVLDRYRVPVTASLNLGVLDRFPEVRDAIAERNWAIMSHGIVNTRGIFGISEDEERSFYQESIDTVKRHTGRDLLGMLTPGIAANYATPDLMAEAGLIYHADWVNDDQPTPLRVQSGKLLSVPYTFELNTGALFYRHFDARYYERTALAQFEVLREDSAIAPRVMCLSLHPFAMGQPQSIRYFDRLLESMKTAEGVWWTTGDAIASYYLDQCYDAQVAYEDSLAGRPADGPAKEFAHDAS